VLFHASSSTKTPRAGSARGNASYPQTVDSMVLERPCRGYQPLP
jgi:hypothetical protein